MKQQFFNLAVGTSLVIAAIASQAQTAPTGSVPAQVGVTPGTASEAASKAVPHSNVGTVVRTSPNAADKAKAATDNVTSSSNTGTAGVAPQTDAGTKDAPARRPRKADRN